jgi:hypothetical protein
MRQTALLILLCVSILGAAQTADNPQQNANQQQPTTPTTPAQATETKPVPEDSGPYNLTSAPEPPRTPAAMNPMYPSVAPDMLQAPKPGHPLDPRDVMILTGKDKPQAAPGSYYYGYPGSYFPGYYGYAAPGNPLPLLSGSDLTYSDPLSSQRLATPRFAPLLFGTVNGRPFFIAGDTLRNNVPLFGPVFTPFLPVSPVFTFGNFSRPPQFGVTRQFTGGQRK